MGLTRVAAVMVAVGLSSSPVTALYCSGDSPAAKACCERDGSTCNQPGKTDDCCHVTPGGSNQQGLLPAAKAEVKAKSLSLYAALPAPLAGSWSAGLPLVIVPSNASDPPQASPPRNLFLRI
jgi:hypothetical protein